MMRSLAKMWRSAKSDARDEFARLEFEEAIRRYCEAQHTQLERICLDLVVRVRNGEPEASGSWVLPGFDVVMDIHVRRR